MDADAIAEGFLRMALSDLLSGLDPLPAIDAARAALDGDGELDELQAWLEDVET